MKPVNFSISATSRLVVVGFPVADILLSRYYVDITDPNDGFLSRIELTQIGFERFVPRCLVKLGNRSRRSARPLYTLRIRLLLELTFSSNVFKPWPAFGTSVRWKGIARVSTFSNPFLVLNPSDVQVPMTKVFSNSNVTILPSDSFCLISGSVVGKPFVTLIGSNFEKIAVPARPFLWWVPQYRYYEKMDESHMVSRWKRTGKCWRGMKGRYNLQDSDRPKRVNSNDHISFPSRREYLHLQLRHI